MSEKPRAVTERHFEYLAARTLLWPEVLPLNVITYAIGCPVFVWILIRRPRVGPIE